MTKQFDNDTLHDAVLIQLSLNWKDRTCVAYVSLVGSAEASILWSDVRFAAVPHEAPWGESASINSVCITADGVSEIEMQSGDTIRISAGKPKIN